MTDSALLSHSLMGLVLRDIFFSVASETESAGIGYKQVGETGAVRVMAYLASASSNRAVNIFLIKLNDMAFKAELLDRQYKGVCPSLMAG